MDLLSKLRLIRPVNCLMMGFAVLVGAYLAYPGLSFNAYSSSLLLGFLTGFSLTGASMAINDYFDRFIDAINEPARPIPSGAVKPWEALAYAAVLTIIGFVAAYMTNLLSLLAAMVAWALSSTYMVKGKRMGFLGNLMVSGCIATPFIYGSLVVDRFNPSNLLFASMAFLSNTGREVTKGIVDVTGDRTHGIKTIAVLKGERTAAYMASALYLSAVAISPLPWIWGLASMRYLALVVLTDLGFIASSASLLRKPSEENARKVKRTVLIWMLLGLTAFLVG
ncbi:MAG: UbiA family prenyltransferase [Candidatus Bathyarchaeia archaeon]